MEFAIEFAGIFLYSCAIILVYIWDYVCRTLSNICQLYESLALPPLIGVKLTLEQLKDFNGRRADGRILVAFKGKIYDVSGDLEFGLGGSLNYVSGTDFSHYLNSEFRLEPMEMRVLVDRWEFLMETVYTCVGIVIDSQGKPLFVPKQRNWQNNETVEDILADQMILDDGFNESDKTKSNDDDIENSLNEVWKSPVNSFNIPLKQIIDVELD